MYWLRTKFRVKSAADLKFLQALYKAVHGEITQPRSIVWRQNPFLELNAEGEYDIQCRLVGPQTVMAVSPRLNKIEPTEAKYTEESKRLAPWIEYIDQSIESEMNRSNDLGYIFTAPEEKCTMHDLILAARYSQHAVFLLPCVSGCIVANPRSVYLSFISLNSKVTGLSGLMFDKDDGFIECFSAGSKSKQLTYLNEKVQQWKKGKCGDLATCFSEYVGHFQTQASS